MRRSECFALICATVVVTTWITTEFLASGPCEPIPEVKIVVKPAAAESACNYGFPALIEVEDSMIIAKTVPYPDARTYNCCHGSLDYVDAHSGHLQKNATCSGLRSPLQATAEFVYVECRINGTPIYEDFYFFLHNHPRGRDALREGALVGGGAPSVIVLIFGEMSRHVFRQELPRTARHLRRVAGALDFRRLQGAASAHRNRQHLIRGRRPGARAIWFEYARRGYATAYGDDCIDAGRKLTPPAALLDRFYPLDFNWESFYAAGRAHIGNGAGGRARPGCLGARPAYARLLDYAAQYVNLRGADNPRPLFGVFFVDAFRYDRGALRRADRRLLRFLRTVAPRLREDTVLMLVGDSVIAERVDGAAIAARRGGNYVKSPPLFYFLAPLSYKIEYARAAAALEWNAKKMVTFADIHRTLQDLIKDNRAKPASASSSYSLLEKIPPGRSCRTVGIDPGWCLCPNGQ